ncbi:MAG TPA: hypothetical protein VGE40_09525 [Bacilli bacterium]
MAKSIQKVMTRGVQNLRCSEGVLENMFQKATELLPKSNFISFDPNGGQVNISNGDGVQLGTLNTLLPTKIWVIFDDYGDRFVATALLPSEY